MGAAAAAAKSFQSCPTLSDPMDCSLPGSSVHGIFQARVLEWGAIASSRMGATLYKSVQASHYSSFSVAGAAQVVLAVKNWPAIQET